MAFVLRVWAVIASTWGLLRCGVGSADDVDDVAGPDGRELGEVGRGGPVPVERGPGCVGFGERVRGGGDDSGARSAG